MKFVNECMDQFKRKSSFDESSDQMTKKLRDDCNELTTCIESLSSDLFYEIFDYLCGYDIFQAFSNLNYYFYQLLNSSSLLFKMELYHRSSDIIHKSIYDQIMLFNRHQILSIHSLTLDKENQIISTFPVDFLFNRLESLTIDSLEPQLIYSLLRKLINLPRLFSLTIDTHNTIKHLGRIYQLIFRLPKLKHLDISADEHKNVNITVSLPMIAINQISPIEHLFIHHPFTFKEFSNIISYTPQLRHLTLMNESIPKSNSRMISPMILSNLTYISIFMYDLKFDKFEKLISKISSKVKILHLDVLNHDTTYLNAERWKEMILQYLPQLEKFYLKYHESLANNSTSQMHISKLNEFFSSFWIERQWIFNAEIEYSTHIMYSIRSYKKRWYEKNPHDQIINSSDQLSKSMQLILIYIFSEDNLDSLCPNIHDIFDVTKIYHLTNYGEIFAGILSKILSQLRQLDSLEISSLLLSKPRNLSNNEKTLLDKISSTNRITKVYLEIMNDIEEIYFLIELCPHMIYLKVDNILNMDMKLFVQLVIKKLMSKSSHQVRLLCFGISIADDQMIEQLNKMIDDEKLLFDYTIKRVLNLIYLKWK